MMIPIYFLIFFALNCFPAHSAENSVSSQIKTQQSDWQKLLKDSIEISTTIQNSVERNKLVLLLRNLQEKSQKDLALEITPDNCFLAEQQRLQWETIANKLKSRLNSAQRNLPEGNDKALIIKILQSLGQEAAKKVPEYSTCLTQSPKPAEPWSPIDHVRSLYIEEWQKYNLGEVKKLLGDFSPSVFISYAWGPEEKPFVDKLANSLKMAGINVRLDIWHNSLSTSIHTDFVSELEQVDYIIVVGSTLYGDKCRQNKNNVVITEARIIAERQKYQPGRILPVLFSGDPKEAFPPFLRDKVFANFTSPNAYSDQLGMVLLALCKYADDCSGIKRTLQSMVEGTHRIRRLSPKELAEN